MNENSISFQTYLILLSFITLDSESQISVFKQRQSIIQTSGFLGGSMRRRQNLENFSGTSLGSISRVFH